MARLDRVLILGCGYAGTAIARLAREHEMSVLTSVRSDPHAASLRASGFEVLQLPSLGPEIAAHVDGRSLVVVAHPPDGETDQRVAPALASAGAVVYLSSTGVYGDHRGAVDDTTPLPETASARSAKRLAAEDAYRSYGATILRCPALYGRDRGLHVRVVRGEHSIPGDGTSYISRIHVDDLARFALAIASEHARDGRDGALPSIAGETFVIGDKEPARHLDVILYICDAYGVPLPPFVPLESVDESLRADRRVDASRARARLGVSYTYPSYRDGMAPAVTGLTKATVMAQHSPYRG